jgi:iron complex outermembrane receptor protein
LRFIGDHSEVDEYCCAVGNWENNFFTPNPPPNGKIGTDATIQELGGTVLSGKDFYDYKVSASFKPESQNEDEGISLQADWQTEYFLVTSISAYRAHDSWDNVDADFYDVDALSRTNDVNQDQYSQELRISDDNDKLSYVAGLYYYYQKLDTQSDTIVGADLATVAGANFNIDLDPEWFPAGSSALNIADQEHNSYAVFGQADYNVTEQFIVTAGLRWTSENKDMTNTFTENPTPAPAGFPLFAAIAPRADVDENFDESKVTGTFKLSWFMNELTMLYASYGTGYKSGGINTDRIDLAFDTVFEPETSEAFELGMKSEFPEQALRLNIALHKTDTDDLQTISRAPAFHLITPARPRLTAGKWICCGSPPTTPRSLWDTPTIMPSTLISRRAPAGRVHRGRRLSLTRATMATVPVTAVAAWCRAIPKTWCPCQPTSNFSCRKVTAPLSTASLSTPTSA